MRRKNERGASLLIILLAVPIMAVSLGSLMVDLPWIDYARARCQTGADSAALAAAATVAKNNCLAPSGTLSADCISQAVTAAQSLAQANDADHMYEPLAAGNVQFISDSSSNPIIRVQIGQPKLPTLFAQIGLVASVSVVAQSFSEAYIDESGTAQVRLIQDPRGSL